MRIVVCMGEPDARRHVTSIVEARGDEVLAETDTAFEASSVAERFGADAVIVEVSAHVALGQDLQGDLERPDRSYFLVLVSDRTADMEVRWPRAAAVDRYDDATLIAALERLADPRGVERRRARSGSVPLRTATGLYDTPATFYEALQAAEPGDVIIALSVGNAGRLDTLGAACRRAIRRQDYLMEHGDQLVAFLPGADVPDSDAALERITRSWMGPEPLHAVRRTIGEGDIPGDVFLEAARAVRESNPEISEGSLPS